jgi:hypothetical protein
MENFHWPESSFREQVHKHLEAKGILYTHRFALQFSTSMRALTWRPAHPASGQLPNLRPVVIELPK